VSFLPDPEQDPECLAFQEELNTFGRLCLTGSTLYKKAVFLDLDITFGNEGGLSFTTYQKKLNLPLYIPAASAHHPGKPKATIFGNLQKY
jgi:hypothetical protein